MEFVQLLIIVLVFPELATQLTDDKSMEPWMVNVRKLYHIWPTDGQVVRDHNQGISTEEPYCSICMLFKLAQVSPHLNYPRAGFMKILKILAKTS